MFPASFRSGKVALSHVFGVQVNIICLAEQLKINVSTNLLGSRVAMGVNSNIDGSFASFSTTVI